jgi:IS605 OrfB family transposase
MQRTIQSPLPFDPDLVETVRQYNIAANLTIDHGWDVREFNKNVLHFATYYRVREMVPGLQSSLVQCARDMASASLKLAKGKNWNCKKPVKKPMSAIRYNERTFSAFLDGMYISVSTIAGRKRYPIRVPRYFDKWMHGTIASLIISVRNGRCIALLSVEFPDNPPSRPPVSFLGVDRGVNRLAVLSDGSFPNDGHVKTVKWKYQQLRRSLQAKGTRRAKRKLKSIAGRERRFMACENRVLAKRIVAKPFDCIVLENLGGIKQNSKKHRKVNKKQRRRHANWAYHQLEEFVIQAAENAGKSVLFVKPHYTSQCCSRCGHVARSNRQKQASFTCTRCGFSLNADLNAARNLSVLGKALHGRATVNGPNVARDEVAGDRAILLQRSVVASHGL